jgi:cysteinyl-tRNA synthetase
MGKWNDGVEISPDMRTQADGWEQSVNNFFTNVKSLIAESSGKELAQLSLDEQDGLKAAIEKADTEVRSALQDSFDTPRAMRAIYELIREANIYIHAQKDKVDVRELEKAARWVTKIVGIFGLDANASPPYAGLGWAVSKTDQITNPAEAVKPYAAVYQRVVDAVTALAVHSDALDALLKAAVDEEFTAVVSTGANDIETLALPYLRATSRVRDELRLLAPGSESKKAILALCDIVRDVDLTDLGVYLDDRPAGQPSLIKFVPKAELLAAREEKLAREREKAALKEAARVAREKAEEERRERARVSPFEMFRSDERFAEFDGEGLPTKMRDGAEVAKSLGKKLKKDWERQKKLWEEFGGKR